MRTVLFFIIAAIHNVLADPASLSFNDCFSNPNVSQKMTVTNVYGQVLEDTQASMYLNLTVIGNSAQQVLPFDTNLATTLFTTTSVLTLNAFSNSSFFCSYLRPTSPLPPVGNITGNYCPLPAGPFAFAATIPWGNDRALTTLTTRLRAVDPFSNEIMCLDVETTPLNPSPNHPYGRAEIIFWCTVALAIAYWVVVGLARIVTALNRGITRPGRGLWPRAQSAGFIIASAISGERFSSSPALLRFCTPSMRDIVFHTQWCTVLAMVAVQWPTFIYPLMAQTAWASLIYNVTLTSGSAADHWNPLATAPYNPPSGFADQIADPTSVLYINPNTPNTLFTLPDNATSGISSFAYTVGVRPQDLFGICLAIFLGIIAGTIVLSCFVWLVDHVACVISGIISGKPHGPGSASRLGARSPAFASKDILDPGVISAPEESRSLKGRDTPGPARSPSRFALNTPLTGRKAWWKFRVHNSSFHGSVLHGNLVRILVLFHLPVTILSAYQMTLSRSEASMASIILAGFSFAIISIIIPALLVARVRFTTTNKLYDETRTLLSLGPLYNHYRHGSQMFACLFFATNVAVGLTVGAGQKSGTAQAIVILVVEVVSALMTSIWLPWGTGASMGLISFLFCVARIVIAVLLVILSPTINIDDGAAAWVAYGILLILALVYLALLLMLVVKLIEALVRTIGGVGFNRSSHVVDSGLLGAMGLVGCCGQRARRHKGGRRPNNTRYKEASNKHDSMSSFTPPTVLGAVSTDSRKGSVHSGPPPSVLKPEHALRPYREDSDDENGYIMGAWQPFSASPTVPSYSPVERTPPKQASGFSRVGGGRANMDTPYAIASSSTQTFPSVEHKETSNTGASLSSSRLRLDSETSPLSLSSNSAMRHPQQQQYSPLPPGAMSPLHVRTKSQTAIIEDASQLVASSSSAAAGGSRRPASLGRDPAPPSSFPVMGDESGGQSKKNKWYHIRRHRAHSSDGTPSGSSPPPQDEEAALESSLSTPTPGRSFVVIRKPQASPVRSQHASFGSSPGPTPTPTKMSFTRDSSI